MPHVIELRADRRAVDGLYGGRFKLIVPSNDAPLIAEAIDGADSASIGLMLLTFEASGEAGTLASIPRSDCEWTDVSQPPTGVCVMAAASQVGREQLGPLATWWAERSPADVPAIISLDGAASTGLPVGSTEPTVLLRYLLRLAWEQVFASERRVAEARGALYELRCECEQLRGALLGMQDRLWSLGDRMLLLTHLLEPCDSTHAPRADAGARVRQFLPISAEGFAGFDLHSPSTPNVGRGHLLITLASRDHDRSLGTWRVDYDALGRGWFRCAFSSALSDPCHALELVVDWKTLAGNSPALSLSRVGAFRELAAQTAGQPLGGALAMMLWSGVPGSRVLPPADGGTSPTCPPADAVEYALSDSDFRRARPLVSAHFQYCHPLDDRPGIRLHPLEGTLASAILQRACAAGTDRLVAVGQIRNGEAQFPVEYGMCLVDSAAQVSEFPTAPESDDRVLGFSGWQPVAADGQVHALTLSLQRPLDRPADLCLATRMPGALAITHEWADWLEIRVRLRAGSVTRVEARPRP